MISIIADFSQFQTINCPTCPSQIPYQGGLNSLCLQIGQPTFMVQQTPTNNLSQLMEKYCLCDFQNNGTFHSEKSNGYQFSANEVLPKNLGSSAYGMPKTNELSTYTTQERSKQVDFESAYISSDCSRKSKRDMVNYKVLEGHKYEIRKNPEKEN